MKQRITLPVLIAIPVYLVLVFCWWRVRVLLPINIPSRAPLLPEVAILMIDTVLIMPAVFVVYGFADGICQYRCKLKLPRETIVRKSNAHFVSRGRSGW